jgi:hypothetical protein
LKIKAPPTGDVGEAPKYPSVGAVTRLGGGVAAVGSAGTLAAGLGVVAGEGETVAAGWLEHAAHIPKSIATAD